MKPVVGREFNPYYSAYIDKIASNTILEVLKIGLDKSLALYLSIPEDKWNFSYAEGKWSIKEIVQHLLDSERVFAYRALCIARREGNELPGYDHDDYVSNSNANSRTKESLIEEYKTVRKSTILLFETFGDDTLLQIGIANGNPMSVRALGYVIAGHEQHHNSVIKERYL